MVNKIEIYPNHIDFVFIVILMEFMNWLKVPASRLTPINKAYVISARLLPLA